jgi:hypothetical protein
LTQIKDLVVKSLGGFFDTNQRFGRKILKGKLMEFENRVFYNANQKFGLQGL